MMLFTRSSMEMIDYIYRLEEDIALLYQILQSGLVLKCTKVGCFEYKGRINGKCRKYHLYDYMVQVLGVRKHIVWMIGDRICVR